jgi:hypothetical protein
MFNKALDHGILSKLGSSVQLHLVEVVNLVKLWAKGFTLHKVVHMTILYVKMIISTLLVLLH